MAVFTLLAASACALLAAAAIPFATIRGHLDSLAGDGSAEPYTPQLHGRLRLYLACLGVAGLFGGLWLRVATARTTQNRSSLERFADDVRQLGTDILGFGRGHLRPLITLTLLALLIRIPWIHQPIRYDEAHSFVNYANRPVYVTIATYAEPNNHVFHNLCVHIATRLLGSEEWTIRLPALVAGVLIVPATYALGHLWGAGGLSWLAALAVAASSPLIEYSVNARGYSLLCLITLCLLLLAHASLRRHSLAVWAAMIGLAAVGLWTVPTMLYGCLLILVWLTAARAVMPQSQSAVGWRSLLVFTAATAALTALLYSPILVVEGPTALMNAGLGSGWGWHNFASGVGQSVRQTGRLLFRDLPWPAIVLMAAGCLLTFRTRLRRQNPAPSLLLLACGACLLLVLLQAVLPPPRTWLFLLPLILCSAVWGLRMSVSERGPAVRAATLLMTGLLLVVWPLISIVRHDSIRKSPEGGVCPDAEAAIVWLKHELLPREPVITTTPCSAPLVYYALRHGLSLEHFDWPGGPRTRDDAAIVVVPAGPHHAATPEEVLRELELNDMFDPSRLDLVQSFPSALLFRASRRTAPP